MVVTYKVIALEGSFTTIFTVIVLRVWGKKAYGISVYYIYFQLTAMEGRGFWNSYLFNS